MRPDQNAKVEHPLHDTEFPDHRMTVARERIRRGFRYLQALNDTGMLLRNDLPHGPTRNWVRLSLDAGGRDHDAIGATVTVRAEGLPEQMFPVYRCQSFLGTDDPRLLVGLGSATKASVSVVWPGPERKRTECTGAGGLRQRDVGHAGQRERVRKDVARDRARQARRATSGVGHLQVPRL